MPTTSDTPSLSHNAAAFDQLREELQAIESGRLRSFRGIAPRRAALACWRIARASQEPALASRFAALASIGEIGAHAPERLARVAQAVLHIDRQLLQHDASVSRARVPAARVEQGYAVRGRLLGVLAYVYEPHDPGVTRQLEVIRQGSGHLDLAEDLVDLADLYKAHKAELKEDGGKHYRAADEAQARQLAAEILDHLTATASMAGEWSVWRKQAMTLLQTTYDEVKVAGRLFSRNDDPEGRYPALQVIAQADRKASREEAEDGEFDPVTPAPDAPTG